MSYFFTNNFRKALFDNPALMTGASFRIRLFRSAPSLSSPAAASWLEASTVAELTSFIGWEEVTGIAGYPGGMHTQSALTVRREGLNNYVLLDQYTFDNLGSEIRIEGIGIEYASGSLNGIANPLIFVTNTPVGTFMNLDPGDTLTSNQDLKLGLAANRWLLAWADTPVVPAGEPQPDWTSLRVIEGPLAFLFAPPLFESSNTLHVWLYPQRANMISNPSFEYDNSQWAPVPTRVREAAFAPVLKGTVSDANALLALAPEVGDFYAVASDPVAQDYPIWEYKGPDPNDDLAKWTNHGVQTGKGWAGKFTAAGVAPLAVESNVWETRLGYNDEETWTLQLLAKGTGKLKLALVSWDIDYRTTGVDWGTETWDLVPGAWVHCTCVRYGPQAHTAMMRIEVVSGTDVQEVILDRVLAERGALKEYPYFDGDEHFGAADDFSWYGGAGRRGVSYSMWYGGRRAVIGRMFATPAVHEGELLTDVDVMAAGMVYDWVPAGVTVIPHLDVFYPTDLHGPLPPRRPTTLPPLGPDDPLGVDDPWTPEALPQGLWFGSTAEIGVAGVSGTFASFSPPQTWAGSTATVGVAGISGALVHTVPTVTINRQLPDPTNISPVKFDVLFSESVTGFTAADITLSGTAPGTLVAVIASTSGLGYVVEVRGMSGPGTVMASIAASVCTSVATGRPNAASTSTDNIIAYQPTGVAPFFDPFTRPDFTGTVDALGADWVQSGGSFYYGVVSGQMLRPGTGANNAITHVAKPQHILPGPDITVEFDLVANPGIFIILYVYIRYDFATNTGYRLTLTNSGGGGANLSIDIEKIISGVVTAIGSNTTMPNQGSGGATPFYPGRWRLGCIGSTITLYTLPAMGGVATVRRTHTDSSIAIGSGVGFQGYSNTNANVQIIDNVYVGDADNSSSIAVFADATSHDVIVPAGATRATLECWGAGPTGVAPITLQGNGAYIKATITGLTPGEVLQLNPGGVGAYAGAGGFNGGGACTGLGGSDGNGGNGASDIRRGGTALANRILIGGGGGGGINASGGGRGGHAGLPDGGVGTATSGNGGGGTQSAGGASVAGPPNGALGVGATSPSGPGGGRGGGGGGGGYYGGGAGASGFGTSCSGGGGSSYYHPSLTLVTAETVGTWTGPGQVKVTFAP